MRCVFLGDADRLFRGGDIPLLLEESGDLGCEWDRAGDLDRGRTMLSFRGVGDLRR